jgi:hypothetical protein
VLEVLITKRGPTKWEWRDCDRQGPTIMNGFESTRPSGQVQGQSGAIPPVGFRLGSVIAGRRGRVAPPHEVA